MTSPPSHVNTPMTTLALVLGSGRMTVLTDKRRMSTGESFFRTPPLSVGRLINPLCPFLGSLHDPIEDHGEESDGETLLHFVHAGVPEQAHDSIDEGWKTYYWDPIKKAIES